MHAVRRLFPLCQQQFHVEANLAESMLLLRMMALLELISKWFVFHFFDLVLRLVTGAVKLHVVGSDSDGDCEVD